MRTSKSTRQPTTTFCGLNRRSSFLSRFTSSTKIPTIIEKPAIHTPYVPTYAASSFQSSTTPVTIEERWHQKQSARLGDPQSGAEDLMTIGERADAMRQRGRERREIEIELVTC